VGGQSHALPALSPGGRASTHCIGGWVGSRAGLGGCGKFRLPPGFDPRNVQAVASSYTDRAIPVIYVCLYQFLYEFCVSYEPKILRLCLLCIRDEMPAGNFTSVLQFKRGCYFVCCTCMFRVWHVLPVALLDLILE
jgi:hypothetical protein